VHNAIVGFWGDENSHIGALNFYPIFIPLLSARFQVSVFSAASGLKSGQFDRTKNLTA
jgi:hypothetical protein